MRRLVVIIVLLAACSSEHRPGVVRVAAASDLARAFEELGREFKTKTGITAEFTFGSSGLLAKQIEQGAPYGLYAAANKNFTEMAIKSGHCDATSAYLYARGRIVVWTPKQVAKPMDLRDLADPRFKRIAIANPEHAPYGLAAKQALQTLGLWDAVKDRIVLGENVQSTLVYARDGNADAAIVALSLATVTEGGTFVHVDPALHEPLDQQLVVCGKGREAEAARKLAGFISSKEGHELMTRYGFLLPGENPAK
ncbi:MAG: molybdate ABC transporter substrate-binding protein [Kofleriaceae bacterium]